MTLAIRLTGFRIAGELCSRNRNRCRFVNTRANSGSNVIVLIYCQSPIRPATVGAIDGFKVGEKARAILGAELLWPPGHGDKAESAKWAREMLLNAADRPAVEVPMLREDLYARADAIVPN